MPMQAPNKSFSANITVRHLFNTSYLWSSLDPHGITEDQTLCRDFLPLSICECYNWWDDRCRMHVCMVSIHYIPCMHIRIMCSHHGVTWCMFNIPWHAWFIVMHHMHVMHRRIIHICCILCVYWCTACLVSCRSHHLVIKHVYSHTWHMYKSFIHRMYDHSHHAIQLLCVSCPHWHVHRLIIFWASSAFK